MFKNNLNIALRMLAKQRAFALINVSGLAIGIACFLLIFLYVKNEFSYDSQHQQKDQIYRITSTFTFGGETTTRASTGHPQPMAYKQDVPEIEEIVRLDADIAVVSKGREFIEQRNVIYADAALFEVFNFEVVDGFLPTSFSQLNGVVITEKMALKYFGEKAAAGKTLRMNVQEELEPFSIVAVIKDHPGNSSFNFEMVLPWAKGLRQIPERRQASWENISIQCFVKLVPGADAQQLAEKLEAVKAARNPGDQGEFARSIKNDLQALSDIHLNADIPGFDGLGATRSGQRFLLAFGHCLNHFIGSLYQLCQPIYRTGTAKGQRGWGEKSSWSTQKTAGSTVSYRSLPDVFHGPGTRVDTHGSFIACV